ncbi:hypothetical protein PsorP6_004395 [Peronosclerospora sorghi]|uniref:Uncharacterized protein n=1 Tax=Peronosclerospora sorghi TaxID=230839 RepID=A0ACC0VPR8_9STRA|nr:hypothetical protein PsorP6_004395 [Peronosclerospora sorghi]
MEELDEEARTLAKRLLDSNPSFSVRPYKMFTTAYKLVKRNGWKEMKQQYHIAIEHYFSALKYPAQSRGFHEGCPSVERDREDARLLFPFSLVDKVNVEPEIVVIDTKPGQNAYVDLSSHESDEAVSAGGNTSNDRAKHERSC